MRVVEIEMGKLICHNCQHVLWMSPVYKPEVYQSQICSECGKHYIQQEKEQGAENVNECINEQCGQEDTWDGPGSEQYYYPDHPEEDMQGYRGGFPIGQEDLYWSFAL